jgi:hypothetical protein
MALATGEMPKYPILLGFLNQNWREALAWLTERRDIHERKEDRLETVEWAILVFVIVGVLADILIVVHELR